MMVRKALYALAIAALTAAVLAQSGQGGPVPGPRAGQGQRTRPVEAMKQDPTQLLRRIVTSQPRLRYRGQRTVELGGGPNRTQHVELVLKDGMRTRIEFPAGSPMAGQVVIENGRQRQHYFPADDEIRISPVRKDEVVQRLVRMGQLIRDGHMRAELGPGGAVANRRTQLLTIKDPRGNPVQRIWVDPPMGMILKREMFDSVGGRIGYFEFTEINYNAIVRDGDFEFNRRGAKVVTLVQLLERMSRRLGVKAVSIPATSGWSLYAVRPLDRPGLKAIEQVYDRDGGTVSLFIVKGIVDAERLKRAAGLRLNSHLWKAGSDTLALIGGVEPNELQRLAGLVAG